MGRASRKLVLILTRKSLTVVEVYPTPVASAFL
jgi:hypothetical protein